MKIDTPKPSTVVNTAVRGARIDSGDLRRALGAFATGVTVVTTLDEIGRPTGFTANSFTSVSLDPPLILVCLAKCARSHPIFRAAGCFAISILAEEQREISASFATAGADKFSGVGWRRESTGAPVLDGVSAWLDCVTHEQVDAGDHVILIGRVVAYGHTAQLPLCYCRGTYINLAMTSALDAAADDSPLRVGAIVERGGKVLFRRDPQSRALRLPTAGRMGRAGDEGGLIVQLAQAGIEVRPSFIYSVFESRTGQEVYYRATALAESPPRDPAYTFRELDDATVAEISDPAVRSMLDRYRAERAQDFFGIYVGTHQAGDVRPLGKGDSQ